MTPSLVFFLVEGRSADWAELPPRKSNDAQAAVRAMDRMLVFIMVAVVLSMCVYFQSATAVKNDAKTRGWCA